MEDSSIFRLPSLRITYGRLLLLLLLLRRLFPIAISLHDQRRKAQGFMQWDAHALPFLQSNNNNMGAPSSPSCMQYQDLKFFSLMRSSTLVVLYRRVVENQMTLRRRKKRPSPFQWTQNERMRRASGNCSYCRQTVACIAVDPFGCR